MPYIKKSIGSEESHLRPNDNLRKEINKNNYMLNLNFQSQVVEKLFKFNIGLRRAYYIICPNFTILLDFHENYRKLGTKNIFSSLKCLNKIYYISLEEKYDFQASGSFC